MNPQWHVTPEQWKHVPEENSLGEQESAKYGTQSFCIISSTKIKWFHEGQNACWGLLLYLHFHLEYELCWRVCLLGSLRSCQCRAPIRPSSSWLIRPWRRNCSKLSVLLMLSQGLHLCQRQPGILASLSKAEVPRGFFWYIFQLKVLQRSLDGIDRMNRSATERGKHWREVVLLLGCINGSWDARARNLILVLKYMYFKWWARKLVGMRWEIIRLHKL